MSPIVLIGFGALILLAGVGVGYYLASLRGRREAARADEIRDELDRYRQEVTEHFGKTAAHFQAIGVEYRKLYEHMASGEAALCESGKPVSFSPPELLADAAAATPPEPPRDYEITDSADAVTELPDIVASGRAAAEAPADLEPTDRELADTEAAEEFIAERELTQDDAEREKTLH